MEGPPIPSLSEEYPGLAGLLEGAATVIELFAVLVLLDGILRFVIAYARAELRIGDPQRGAARMNAGRVVLSRYILAALEVFIVSDIIRTVLSPTLEALAVLGALVVIRSTISFFLGREIREIEQAEEGR
jgi:uncharacterized membrane protein